MAGRERERRGYRRPCDGWIPQLCNAYGACLSTISRRMKHLRHSRVFLVLCSVMHSLVVVTCLMAGGGVVIS